MDVERRCYSAQRDLEFGRSNTAAGGFGHADDRDSEFHIYDCGHLSVRLYSSLPDEQWSRDGGALMRRLGGVSGAPAARQKDAVAPREPRSRHSEP